MKSYQNERSLRLSGKHRCKLLEKSEIAAERRCRTTSSQAEVKMYQCRAGLPLPIFSPFGDTTGSQLCADSLRKSRTVPPKCESPSGSKTVLDMDPCMWERGKDGSEADEDYWVTEESKKGCFPTSRDFPTAGLIKVRNWQRAIQAGASVLFTRERKLMRSSSITTAAPPDI